jgi:methyl-accepting chemotaxis protein
MRVDKVKHLRTKIVAVYVSSMVVLAILLCVIAGLESKTLLTDEATNGINLLVKNQSVELSSEMNMIKSAVNYLAINSVMELDANNIQDEQYMEQEMPKIKSMIENISKDVPSIIDAYVVFDTKYTKSDKVYHRLLLKNDNNGFDDAGEVLTKEQLDSKDDSLSWYFNPQTKQEGVWSEPYEDQTLNKKMITYSVPIYLEGQIVGTAGMDIAFSLFEDIVNGIKVYDTGYAMLLNRDLNLLIHPSAEPGLPLGDIIDQNADETIQLMSSQDIGVSRIVSYNTTKYVAFSRLENGFVFAVAAPMKEILKGVYEMISMLVLLSFISMLAAIAVGILFGNRIANPINHLVQVIQVVETGDLTQQAKEKSKDEIGTLAKSFNNMVRSENIMIKDVYQSSTEMNDNAGDLAQSSERMMTSYDEINHTMREIAESSNSQAISMTQIMQSMDEFNKEMNGVVQNIGEVEQEAQRVNGLAKDSENQLRVLGDWVREINQAFGSIKDNILGLNGNIQQVTQVIEMINSIAVQTNLLALNASIEAARAGDAGKGFAVVAQEIGKLAAQTRVSSESISTSLSSITQTAKETASTTEEMNTQISDKVGTIEEALSDFQTIIASIEAIIPRVQNINKRSENIDNKKDIIISSVESITGEAQEVSASTEEISALLEDMSAVTSSVSDTAQKLNYLSEKLFTDVKKFKV